MIPFVCLCGHKKSNHENIMRFTGNYTEEINYCRHEDCPCTAYRQRPGVPGGIGDGPATTKIKRVFGR